MKKPTYGESDKLSSKKKKGKQAGGSSEDLPSGLGYILILLQGYFPQGENSLVGFEEISELVQTHFGEIFQSVILHEEEFVVTVQGVVKGALLDSCNRFKHALDQMVKRDCEACSVYLVITTGKEKEEMFTTLTRMRKALRVCLEQELPTLCII